jgi:hypothetical protein
MKGREWVEDCGDEATEIEGWPGKATGAGKKDKVEEAGTGGAKGVNRWLMR